MTEEQLKKNNEVFTTILVVQEVSQRLLSELIGVDEVTMEVKQSFNLYLKHGEKFRNKWAKQIEQRYGANILELHETDADNNYEIFKSVNKLRTDVEYELAKFYIESVKTSGVERDIISAIKKLDTEEKVLKAKALLFNLTHQKDEIR